MIRLHTSSHKIDMVFVIGLFTVFAATAFLLVLIGAKQYQKTADGMNYNYEVRTASSYLTEKIRQNDTCGEISVTPFAESEALTLYTTENERTYITYIYYYDGWLRELFVSESAVFSPESGQKIVEVSGFSASMPEPNLLKLSFTGTDGTIYPVYLAVHAGGGREAL